MAGAMEALLPAVDANDEAKTLACFRFFCVVLSSVPSLEVDFLPSLIRSPTPCATPGHWPPCATCIVGIVPLDTATDA